MARLSVTRSVPGQRNSSSIAEDNVEHLLHVRGGQTSPSGYRLNGYYLYGPV